VSLPGALHFLLKLAFGYVIIATIGTKFKIIFFNTIFFISLISLVGFIWHHLGFDIPSLYKGENELKSLIFFTQNSDGMRNAGMFWEPGVFACYIVLCLSFYIGNINELFKNHTIKLIIVLTALATTQSTTGYIVFFFLALVNLWNMFSWKKTLLILPFIIFFSIASYIIFTKSGFLEDKVKEQYDETLDLQGEFSPNRFGALMFDIHYIKKHPLIGNGLHEKTRYADHPYLFGQDLGHGNGFSNFLASMGFLSLWFYSYYILKFKSRFKWIFLLIIFMLLQGEDLILYSLFLSIPFTFIFNDDYCNSYYLPQPA
jgi:lysophospholipid acyltransferase (LPLAT)-like uncharacterized protein